jgi:hypothetical protein
MKNFALLVVFMAICSSSLAQYQTVEIGEIQVARTLTGTLVDPVDSAVPGVHVLELSSDWQTVLRTTTTDSKGRWSLPPRPGQLVYYLRFVADGFDLLQVRVQLNRRKGKNLRLKLTIAT